MSNIDELIDSIITRANFQGSVNRIRLQLKEAITKATDEARQAEIERTIIYYGNFTCKPEWAKELGKEETLEDRVAKLKKGEV